MVLQTSKKMMKNSSRVLSNGSSFLPKRSKLNQTLEEAKSAQKRILSSKISKISRTNNHIKLKRTKKAIFNECLVLIVNIVKVI